MLLEIQVQQIGYSIKTHGVKGEIVVKTDLYLDEIISEKDSLFFRIDKIEVPFFCEHIRHLRNDEYAVKLKRMNTKEQAAMLTNKSVSLQTQQNQTDKSPQKLKNYRFEDLTSAKAGEIIDVYEINDDQLLLALVPNDVDSEYLVPFHEDFIVELKEAEKNIIFRLPNGIFDL